MDDSLPRAPSPLPTPSSSTASLGNVSEFGTTAPTTTNKPSPAEKAKAELESDFGVQKEGKLADAQQLKLKCNWKMAAGIALGVVVGVVVLALVLAALGASHGALAPVLIPMGKVASALLSHIGVSSAIGGISSLGVSAAAAEVGISITILFGGGGAAGALFRRGEQKELGKLLQSSDQALAELEGDKRIDISEVEDYIRFEQSTVTSSQAGKNFIDLERRFRLQSSGVKTLGLFGYFWSAIPGVAARSLGSDQAQYSKRMEHYDREVDLKKASAGDKKALSELGFSNEEEALDALNDLRDIQIGQLVSKNSAVSKAYEKAPEILAIDMSLAKLRLLLTREKDPSKIKTIQERIQIEEEKKSQLINARMEAGSKEHSAVFSPKSPIKSLFSISSDIDKLPDLDAEQKGQLLEATAIYLEKHPDATIEDVNHLVSTLTIQITTKGIMGVENWNTRAVAIQFAQQFPLLSTMKEKEKKGVLGNWQEKANKHKNSRIPAPMSIGRAALSAKLAGLRALDVAIVGAHTLPGGSVLSTLPTAAAIAVEKGTSPVPEAIAARFRSHTFTWEPSETISATA